MERIAVKLSAIRADENFNFRKLYEDNQSGNPEDLRPRIGTIAELAADIGARGLVTPLIVMRSPSNPNAYDLVCGFRRHRALTVLPDYLSGKAEVPVQVFAGGTHDAYLLNLHENLARKNLETWEIADACVFLADKLNWSAQKIAEKVGMSKSYVNHLISIVRKVRPEILTEWRKGHGGLSMTAMIDLYAKKPEEQKEVWDAICARPTDTVDTGDGVSGATDGTGNGKSQVKRGPGREHLSMMLRRLQRSDEGTIDFRRGAIEGVKYALGMRHTLGAYYDAARERKEAQAEKEAEKKAEKEAEKAEKAEKTKKAKKAEARE